MATLLSVLVFIVCILLILIVLVQNSKGGGLSSSFSSSNQIMGVKKTADFLEKSTWFLAIGLLALCLVSAMFIGESTSVAAEETTTESVTKKKIEEQSLGAPVAPTTPVQTAPETTGNQ
ncbi:MAG: preprotein translocase subunit SecG [Bacteroidetes bacterium]|nr:preprotein translocase subunit SecG [Bacteroidota bacterium]